MASRLLAFSWLTALACASRGNVEGHAPAAVAAPCATPVSTSPPTPSTNPPPASSTKPPTVAAAPAEGPVVAQPPTYERLPGGGHAEYYSSGKLRFRSDAHGNSQSWYENGRLQEEIRHVGDEWLVWNTWAEDGKPVIRNGNGVMHASDGELAFPVLVTYRGGRVVARKLLPPPKWPRRD